MGEGRNKQILIALAVTLGLVGGIFLLAKFSPANQEINITAPEITADNNIQKMSTAGTFYPNHADQLNTQLDNLLTKSEKKSFSDPIRILIVPHAGLDYSGQVAAAGYKQLAGGNVKKIFILASSHFHTFSGAVVNPLSAWETPLGNVNIDSNTVKALVTSDGQIKADSTVFEKEHPGEIQVVWIKKILPEAKIVPMLLGQITEAQISVLAYRIAQNMDENSLLVVSTDLSHYPDYESAKKIDSDTIQKIIKGDLSGLGQKVQGAETTACGADALRIANKVSELMNLEKPVLIKYQNSGDVSADKTRVVGYAALAVTGKNTKLIIPDLSPEAKSEALNIARKTLDEFVSNKKTLPVRDINNAFLREPLGAFVTLEKDGQLRGCIGEFEPTKPLYEVVRDKTIAAASRDPRFRPVTTDELTNIKIEISVMTPRQKIDDWKKISLGIDGVVLILDNKMGTFLPQVATDNNWTLENFVGELCSQKMGLSTDCYKNPAIEIFTYQVQVFE